MKTITVDLLRKIFGIVPSRVQVKNSRPIQVSIWLSLLGLFLLVTHILLAKPQYEDSRATLIAQVTATAATATHASIQTSTAIPIATQTAMQATVNSYTSTPTKTPTIPPTLTPSLTPSLTPTPTPSATSTTPPTTTPQNACEIMIMQNGVFLYEQPADTRWTSRRPVQQNTKVAIQYKLDGTSWWYGYYNNVGGWISINDINVQQIGNCYQAARADLAYLFESPSDKKVLLEDTFISNAYQWIGPSKEYILPGNNGEEYFLPLNLNTESAETIAQATPFAPTSTFTLRTSFTRELFGHDGYVAISLRTYNSSQVYYELRIRAGCQLDILRAPSNLIRSHSLTPSIPQNQECQKIYAQLTVSNGELSGFINDYPIPTTVLDREQPPLFDRIEFVHYKVRGMIYFVSIVGE